MCVRTSSLIVRLTSTLLLAGGLSLLCAERAPFAAGELRLGERRFQVRGLHYAPVPIGARALGPGPPRLYARDLPLAAAMGANTVRTLRLLPDGDTTFVPLLETTGLHWLAGFPLEPYYDPSLSILERRDEILADLPPVCRAVPRAGARISVRVRRRFAHGLRREIRGSRLRVLRPAEGSRRRPARAGT